MQGKDEEALLNEVDALRAAAAREARDRAAALEEAMERQHDEVAAAIERAHAAAEPGSLPEDVLARNEALRAKEEALLNDPAMRRRGKRLEGACRRGGGAGAGVLSAEAWRAWLCAGARLRGFARTPLGAPLST